MNTESTRKPHICFVSASSAMYTVLMDAQPKKTGGAELQQKLISRMLAEQGLDVEFIVHSPDGGGTEVSPDGIRVTRGIPAPTGPRLVRSIRPWIEAIRSMRSVNADVYYQRTSARVTGIVGLYCSMKGMPFVFSCAHDMDVDGSYEKACNPVDRALYRKALTFAAEVLVQTDDQMALLRKNYHRSGVLIRNMYPMPESSDPRSKRDAVIWVGSFRAMKRPEMFAELASRIPDRQFIMIGGRFAAEAELYDRVVERAKQIPNLTLTGQLAYDEAAEYYRRALVLVNTSTSGGEGFPNTFLQAWSVGTPTVATFDPDGIISKQELGSHCDGLDDLASSVANLLADDEARIGTGERAIEYVRTHHDPASITRQYVEVLTRLSESRGAEAGRL